MGVTVASKQNLRPYQEDYFFFMDVFVGSLLSGRLLAVMDGHRGKEVAEYCEGEIRNIFQNLWPGPAETVLKELVAELNFRTNHFQAGSTISLALISDALKQVVVAVLGDSPVVVLDEQGKLHLSPEHNVRSNLKERKAAEQRGGIYKNGYIWNDLSDLGQVLQMGRALGDVQMGHIISKEPDVYTIDNPVWVLVASDGLFDPEHSNTKKLVKEIRKYAQRKANAGQIMKWAEKRGLEDNTTALVWYPD